MAGQHFGDDFRWFMRADDDVYINFKALMSLLAAIRSFNQSDQPVMHYVGRVRTLTTYTNARDVRENLTSSFVVGELL